MRKILSASVIAATLSGPVLAQIDPSVFRFVAAYEKQQEKERKQKIYMGIGVAAILIAWGYLIRKKNTSKKCPKCSELVKKEALVCKHCGNQFDSTNE